MKVVDNSHEESLMSCVIRNILSLLQFDCDKDSKEHTHVVKNDFEVRDMNANCKEDDDMKN